MTLARARGARLSAGAALVFSLGLLDAAAPDPMAAPDRDGDLTQPDRDWPMFGGSAHRNLANTVAKNIPTSWSVARGREVNVKWKAALGDSAYGGPVVAGGRVFVGTNNGKPRDPGVTGDKSVMMCFRESDGAFLWQIVHDKLDNTEIDPPGIGIASTPAVDGDRLYYVSNRCELVCADVAGDPAAGGKGKIVWSLDMRKDLGVHPGGLEGGMAGSSPLVLGDLVYVGTSNGVDANTGKPRSPEAPSLLAVHKDSGKVAWGSNLPGGGILDLQFGSPAAAEVNGAWEVLFPGGDGWLYAFEAKKGELLWKFDCNPKKSVFKPAVGEGTRNYLLATPVVADGKAYIGVGREPDAGPGVGHLWCIDFQKKPANADKDLSPVDDNFDPKDPVNRASGLVWHFGGMMNPNPANGDRDYSFGRTMSTVAVHAGLVYAAELDGYLHCLDAQTGKEYWQHDLGSGTWSSPYYVDGKVFMGTENGDLFVVAAGKKHREPVTIDMRLSLKVSPVAANGRLYVTNGAMLYAIAGRRWVFPLSRRRSFTRRQRQGAAEAAVATDPGSYRGGSAMIAATKWTLVQAMQAVLAVAMIGGLAAAEEPKVDLKVGDPAPAFDAVDDLGQPWKAADHIGKKYVVVYFFPGDFTPGCTRQAQNFRDAMNKLNDEGVEVVGVSGDAVLTHQLFKKAQKLNFTLLSDEEGKLAGTFGVPVGKGAEVKTKDADGQPLTVKRALTASRWTFVIGRDGQVVYKNTQVNPVKDSKEVADLIEKLEKP